MICTSHRSYDDCKQAVFKNCALCTHHMHNKIVKWSAGGTLGRRSDAESLSADKETAVGWIVNAW